MPVWEFILLAVCLLISWIAELPYQQQIIIILLSFTFKYLIVKNKTQYVGALWWGVTSGFQTTVAYFCAAFCCSNYAVDAPRSSNSLFISNFVGANS